MTITQLKSTYIVRIEHNNKHKCVGFLLYWEMGMLF